MLDLNYKDFGAGEPIVIIHGLFGTLDNWQTIAKYLSEHYSVYILDLRNHGRSPHTEGVFDYTILSEDISQFMRHHWIFEARIIGHSMGGKAAMQLALNHADLVKKLVVIDIAPKRYKGGHEIIFDALFDIDLTTVDDRKDVEKFLMERLDNEVGTVQFLLKNLSRKPEEEGGGFEWKMNLTNLYNNYDNILGPVTGDPFEKPTLFIRGGNSPYIKDTDMGAIKQYFPNAELATVEGAGHWVHAEKPRELLDLLLKFL
jgi:esterase